MTRLSSLTDYDPSADLDGRHARRLERLEFGKFCVEVERRPVERNRDIPVEYSQLGWSAGFPEELRQSCYPKSIGISEGESDPPPPDAPHGTVLRPVLVGGDGKRLQSLFYRVQMRPEDGEGRGGRRYTIARYLVAEEDGPDPGALLQAMNSLPLQGMTRHEASAIAAIEAPSTEVESSPVVNAFMRKAVTLILSGISLSIISEITEQEFFSCVAALWRALPPALRPLLSAGWGVGSSYSGRLAVVRASQRAPDAALFCPDELRWARPDCVTTWDESDRPVSNTFFKGRLRPARSYTRYVFSGAGGKWSASFTPHSERVAGLVGALPPLKLSALPDWRERLLVRAFRDPGLRAEDHFDLGRLERWLRTGAGDADPQLCLDARSFTYEATRHDALYLILGALAHPFTRRRRGDRALWLSLVGGCPDSFENIINGASGAGSHRALLLLSVARRDALQTLGNLLLAEQHGEANDLLPEAEAALGACLNDSTQAAARNHLHAHARLLQSPPETYLRWLRRNPLPLMRAMACWPDDFGAEVYDRIIELSQADDALAFHELIKGSPPPPSAANYVNQLPAERRAVFVEQFNQDWLRLDGNVADRRERLLEWFRALGLRERVHLLLRLAAGERLSQAEADQLADEVEKGEQEVEGGYVPPSLVPVVAAFVLNYFQHLGRRVRLRARQWSLIHAQWPSRHARALVNGVGVRDQRLVHRAVAEAARGMLVPFDVMNSALRERIMFADFGDLAQLFWEWAVRLAPRPGSRPTAVDLCWHVSNGELPNLEPSDPSEVDIFARLAIESGMAAKLSETSLRLWTGARSGWHLLLLLRTFRDVDFWPSASQLGWLVWYQDELIAHLRNGNVSQCRRDTFSLATQPFQSLPFTEYERTLWRPDYATNSVIWAAFSRVPLPLKQEGALRTALRAYTSSPLEPYTEQQSTELLERQARLCLTFLNSYEGSASEATAVRMILNDFVFPRFRSSTEERVKERFVQIGNELKLPDYNYKRRYEYPFDPELRRLMRELAVHTEGKLMMQYVSAYFRR